ncbi:MAG: RNA polymerase sigma factor [Bacteroidales bacterium]|nr:RNA polymerase sigma factor [Bacteroidales bacterium]
MDRPPPNTEPTGERLLVSRALQGDRVSLEELLLRYRFVAYRVAYRLLGNEADALDAVQDGFVNALTHMARFRAESSFKTWLLRVVSNAAMDLGRRRRRHDQRAIDCPQWDDLGLMDAHSPPPGLALDRADLRRQLDCAISQLPESQRQTFVLHADGGLTYQEIADVQGISIGTVMSRLFYARQRLKILLADQVLR